MTSMIFRTFLNSFQRHGFVNRILVTGGCSTFGADLYPHLKQIYGADNVLYTDTENKTGIPDKHFRFLDVAQKDSITEATQAFKPDTIIHLSNLSIAEAENNPALALKMDAEGSRNIIESATEHNLRIFAASSVATFGSLGQKRNVTGDSVQRPESMHGITKYYMEMIGNYHRTRHGTDFRCLRFPVIVSPTSFTGSSSTDFIDMYYGALEKQRFTTHMRKNKNVPAIYVDDAITSMLKLIEAPKENLKNNTFNVSGCSFSATSMASSIQRAVPGFRLKYKEDSRTEFFDSWPETLNDSEARAQWGFDPVYGLDEITASMVEAVSLKVKSQEKDVSQSASIGMERSDKRRETRRVSLQAEN